MHQNPTGRKLTSAIALGALTAVMIAPPVAADEYRTNGSGRQFWTSWTEYDLDDSLGLPGNVHVGYLSGWSDQYGQYMFGNVTDFDCDEGEIPGYGHGIEEGIVDDGARAAEAAAEEAVEEIIDSGANLIDADTVVAAIAAEIAESVPAAIVEAFEEEVPFCDYVQDRFLDGTGTAEFTVNIKTQVAQVTGTITVTGGGHGEPGDVLGTPPVNLTISGGDWQKYESSYSYWGADYRYSYWSEGTDYFGGTVTGAIGGMGFDDDEDDESYGGYGTFKFKTVEKIR